MEQWAYYQLAAIEDTHWWSVYRRQLIAQMIWAAGGIHGADALDIGSGTGGNLPFLQNYCATVSGLDLSEDAIALALGKFPRGNFRRGDVNYLSELYSAKSFDLVSDFHVLYHSWVKSDLQSMRDVYRLLRPGGIFIVTEPAFAFLRRAHDVVGHGARRYTLGHLRRMLTEVGFRNIRGSYFNLPIFPIALLLAVVDRFRSASLNRDTGLGEIKLPPKWLNETLSTLLGLELSAIRAFGRIPIGVSIACVARKADRASAR